MSFLNPRQGLAARGLSPFGGSSSGGVGQRIADMRQGALNRLIPNGQGQGAPHPTGQTVSQGAPHPTTALPTGQPTGRQGGFGNASGFASRHGGAIANAVGAVRARQQGLAPTAGSGAAAPQQSQGMNAQALAQQIANGSLHVWGGGGGGPNSGWRR